MTTPLAASATQLHELFTQLQAAGFTREEALYLVGQVLAAATTQGGSGS